MFANFRIFSGRLNWGDSFLFRGCGGTICTDDANYSGRRPPLRSSESREQKPYTELNLAFGAGVLESINPGAIARDSRELRPWRLPLRNRRRR